MLIALVLLGFYTFFKFYHLWSCWGFSNTQIPKTAVVFWSYKQDVIPDLAKEKHNLH